MVDRPLGVAALLLAVRGAPGGRAAGLGLIAGWAFFLPLLHWLTVLGWDAWLAPGFGDRRLVRRNGVGAECGGRSSLVAVGRSGGLGPAGWLRSRFPWGGLGWGRLAFGQPDSPFTGWVTVGGAPLLTAAVALAGCLLVLAMTSWRAAAGAVVGLLGIGLVGGLVWPVTSPEAPPAASRLAVVQGNVPQPGIDFLGRPLAVLSNHQHHDRARCRCQAG